MKGLIFEVNMAGERFSVNLLRNMRPVQCKRYLLHTALHFFSHYFQKLFEQKKYSMFQYSVLKWFSNPVG